MTKVHRWKCGRCGEMGVHEGAICNGCLKSEHHDRWRLLPTPTKAEIDDACAWLNSVWHDHDPVSEGFYVEDPDGEDQGEEFCHRHAQELAATLGEGASVFYAGHGETDGERWCAHAGCGRQLDVGSFTKYGVESVLGITEGDPMRAGTNLYGLNRVGWNMTPTDPTAPLWMWHVDNHRSDMDEALAKQNT